MNAEFIDYMNGWRIAAGGLAIPPETKETENFLQGWKDGKAASRNAQHNAAMRFKTMVRYLRAMDAQPPSTST